MMEVNPTHEQNHFAAAGPPSHSEAAETSADPKDAKDVKADS
jgi:hypothetical protein